MQHYQWILEKHVLGFNHGVFFLFYFVLFCFVFLFFVVVFVFVFVFLFCFVLLLFYFDHYCYYLSILTLYILLL